MLWENLCTFFFFWGISLFQIVSDLFNSINYQHLQKILGQVWGVFGELEVTINKSLILQNLQIIRRQLHAYTKFCDIFLCKCSI